MGIFRTKELGLEQGSDDRALGQLSRACVQNAQGFVGLLNRHLGTEVVKARNLVGIAPIVARAAIVLHEDEVFAGDFQIGPDTALFPMQPGHLACSLGVFSDRRYLQFQQVARYIDHLKASLSNSPNRWH